MFIAEQYSNGKEDDCTSELTDLFQRTIKLESLLEESDVRLLTSQDIVQHVEREVQRWRNKESYIRGLLCAAVGEKQETDVVPDVVRLIDGRIII